MLQACWAGGSYLAELTQLRDHLKAGLSGVPPTEKEQPSVADLAERIKTLRAVNTVEAAPQRTAKRVSAEEPVTTRIRRREAEEPGTVVDDVDVASASSNRVSEQSQQPG